MPEIHVRPPGWVGAEGAGQGASLFEWAERAEALGLDGVFVGDRMLPEAANRDGTVYAATMLDPVVALAAIAARTSRIKLGPLVMVVPFRHPIQLAKLTASLDAISGGRLILGVGTGWNPPEFAALGVPRAERGERLEESLRILRELWSGRSAAADRFWKFAGVSLAPLPIQRGGPPVWMASFSPGSALDWKGDVPGALIPVLDRIGRLADGWVPLIYSASHRRRIDPSVLGAAWDRVQEAAAAAGRRQGAVQFVLSDWIYILDGPGSEARCREALAGFFAGTWEEALATYNIGSPAQVVARLHQVTAAVDRVSSYVLTPLSGEREQLELLASTVAPALR